MLKKVLQLHVCPTQQAQTILKVVDISSGQGLGEGLSFWKQSTQQSCEALRKKEKGLCPSLTLLFSLKYFIPHLLTTQERKQ